MLLAWALSCDSYELHDDATADIYLAGFDTFFIEELPAEVDFLILARLLLMEDETDEIQLEILGPPTPEGGPVGLGSFTYEIKPRPGINHRPGSMVGQIEAFVIPEVPVGAEGIYSVELYVGSEHREPTEERRRSIFFNVYEGLPEGH